MLSPYKPSGGKKLLYAGLMALGSAAVRGAATETGKFAAKKAAKYLSAPSSSSKKRTASKVQGKAKPIYTRPYKRRRKHPYKRRTFKRKSKHMRKLCSKVKHINRLARASIGTMTYRKTGSATLRSNLNERARGTVTGNSKSVLNLILANLRYYDPTTPSAALVKADFDSGTYSKQATIKYLTQTCTFRNNYQSDCKLRVYVARCKDDTASTVVNVWDNTYAATIYDATNSDDLAIFPSDLPTLKQIWDLKLLSNTALTPGQSVQVSHTEKNIKIDPSILDTQSDNYQPQFKSFQIFYMIEGTVMHDTSAAEYAISQAGVDIYWRRTACVEYDAGTNAKFAVLDTDLNTITNAAVQSHQPVPDNVGYSVS